MRRNQDTARFVAQFHAVADGVVTHFESALAHVGDATTAAATAASALSAGQAWPNVTVASCVLPLSAVTRLFP